MMAKHWSILQLPGNEGWCCAEQTGRQKSFSQFSEIFEQQDFPYACKGHIQLCFYPEDLYLMTEQFPDLKPELLSLQINKRFNDLGLAIDGGAYVHRRRRSALNSETNCVFVRQDFLDELYEQIRVWQGVKSLRLVPVAAAIAGLLQKITEKAIIVLLLGRQTSQVLVVKDGSPLYSQALTQAGDGIVDESLVLHALDFARMSVRKSHDVDEFFVTRFGPFRNNLDLTELGVTEWTPDFSQVCGAASPEDVFRFPGIYGAAFADSSYDFLPGGYALSWKMQRASKVITAATAILGCILFGGWLSLQPELKQLKLQYLSLSSSLAGDQRRIAAAIPESAVLDNFDRLVNIRARSAQDVRLDILARKISLALPAQVRVTSLNVSRIKQAEGEESALQPPPDVSDAANGLPLDIVVDEALSVPERLQRQNAEVTLAAVSTGTHDEITSRFENAIAGINRLFDVQDLNWTYRESDQTGILRCQFLPLVADGLP